jgi:hypothetical protein
MYRRLSTTEQKVKAKIYVGNLLAKLDEHAAFMIRLKRKSTTYHTTVQWPLDREVKFDEVVVIEATLYATKPGVYKSKTCELHVS